MRIVLDTNVLVSALIVPSGASHQLWERCAAGDYELVTSLQQLEELERVLQYPKLQRYLPPGAAADLLIQIRDFAVFAEQLPTMNVASDPADNVILATAVAGGAEYLVTGDKRHLLALPSGQACAIVTVRQMLDVFDVK